MFLANLFMVVTAVFGSDPIFIMPLGDSITKGDFGGYRQKLYLNLTNDGFNVDFVGNQSDPDEPDPPEFDTDHEGHDGYHADHIRDNLYDWLALNPADIVLLHIGTNDINHEPPDEDVGEVEDILDEIDRYSEDITVILARIILRTDDYDLNETTKAFNDAVENMALSRISNGDDIVIVDMDYALNYPDDMKKDGVHPLYPTGYEKMADVWYNAISERIDQPPVADANGPYTGTEGVAITFDGSGSSDPDGTIVSYLWDFGDGGTSTGQNPTYAYSQAGSYTVTLTVTDDDSATDTDTTSATVADTGPVADFTASPTSGPAPLTVTFTDASTSYDGVVSWAWDFGDGETSTDQNPTHIYDEQGSYTVSVTVEESDGDSDTETKTDYIIVNEGAQLSLDGVTAWYWTDNTTVTSLIEGDVDFDGATEIVTAGYYFDGTRDVAQLVVWNGSTLTVDRLTTWYWTDNTRINSVAVGNLDKDEALEIVTGGYYFDGTRKVAQLVVWDGATLAVENLVTWYWTNDTQINSVVIADIDGNGSPEIITGGFFNDGVRDVAQLVVWDSETLLPLRYTSWYWTGETRINTLSVENVDGDAEKEIVTGGYYTDGSKIAQLVVWDGIALSPKNIVAWNWTSGDTEINSVVAENVDSDEDVEIVTGGYYNDNDRDVAQLVIWSSDLHTVENLAVWYWTGDTRIESVCVGDADSDGLAEIITGGHYNDEVRDWAQLVVCDGSTLAVDVLTTWYWTGDTRINSVVIGNADGDVSSEIITGGHDHDGARTCAQTTIWEIS